MNKTRININLRDRNTKNITKEVSSHPLFQPDLPGF
jgi:hypothetical protein